MISSKTVDVQAIEANSVSMEAKIFASEMLGPMPGQWDGYDAIVDDETRRDVWSKVGYIHGLSAEAGRTVIAIGETLLAIKEMLPHGQFMACVKAEFGWSRAWACQLMAVAERFTNVQSTIHLPSSAQVLALLAAANADDSTVQQAAEEQWTVKETKRRLGSERQRERTLVQETLSVLKLSTEARQLAAKAEHISTRQLMDELGVEELPKGKEHKTAHFTFCKNGTGWWKLPIEQSITMTPEPEPDDLEKLTQSVDKLTQNVEILPLAVAAQRIGKKVSTLRMRLTPGQVAQKGYLRGNGWQVEPYPARGVCLVRQA